MNCYPPCTGINQLSNVGFIPRDALKREAHGAHPKIQQDYRSASILRKTILMSALSLFNKLQEGSRRDVPYHEELEDLSYNCSSCRNGGRCEKIQDDQRSCITHSQPVSCHSVVVRQLKQLEPFGKKSIPENASFAFPHVHQAAVVLESPECPADDTGKVIWLLRWTPC